MCLKSIGGLYSLLPSSRFDVRASRWHATAAGAHEGRPLPRMMDAGGKLPRRAAAPPPPPQPHCGLFKPISSRVFNLFSSSFSSSHHLFSRAQDPSHNRPRFPGEKIIIERQSPSLPSSSSPLWKNGPAMVLLTASAERRERRYCHAPCI